MIAGFPDVSSRENMVLEHIPGWLGHLMRDFRAGHQKLVVAHPGIALAEARIELTSSAFADRARMPARFTADGDGLSPPLSWGDIPPDTQSLVLIVEDPDAPAPFPLVHGLIWRISPAERQFVEGAIRADGGGAGHGPDVGRNSYLVEGWLPPDPPTGHGVHDYVFQLFALDVELDIDVNPGRSEIVRAITGHVLGTGLLVGTYSREALPETGDGSLVGERRDPFAT